MSVLVRKAEANVHHFSHRRCCCTASADAQSERSPSDQPKRAIEQDIKLSSSLAHPSHMRARDTDPTLPYPSARGITCDVAMRIRNNAILAYGIAAVCRLCVVASLPALLCFHSSPLPSTSRPSLVSQSHGGTVSRRRGTFFEAAASMGIPARPSQLAHEDEKICALPLVANTFTSPGSLSLLKYTAGRLTVRPLRRFRHTCVCRMRCISCTSILLSNVRRGVGRNARTAKRCSGYCTSRAASTSVQQTFLRGHLPGNP